MLQYGRAGSEDIKTLFLLNKEMIDTYENIDNINYDKVLSWVNNKIKMNINEYNTIIYHNQKVGYIYQHMVGEMMEIDDFYIFPAYRNKGIGTAVLQECINSCHSPIFLYVFSANQKAVNLYLRMGFTITKNIRGTRYIMEYHQPDRSK